MNPQTAIGGIQKTQYQITFQVVNRNVLKIALSVRESYRAVAEG
jgi:hypothetical protein